MYDTPESLASANLGPLHVLHERRMRDLRERIVTGRTFAALHARWANESALDAAKREYNEDVVLFGFGIADRYEDGLSSLQFPAPLPSDSPEL